MKVLESVSSLPLFTKKSPTCRHIFLSNRPAGLLFNCLPFSFALFTSAPRRHNTASQVSGARQKISLQKLGYYSLLKFVGNSYFSGMPHIVVDNLFKAVLGGYECNTGKGMLKPYVSDIKNCSSDIAEAVTSKGKDEKFDI